LVFVFEDGRFVFDEQEARLNNSFTPILVWFKGDASRFSIVFHPTPLTLKIRTKLLENIWKSP